MSIDQNTKDSSTKVTPLSNQVAVVTGAGRGIGAAIARKLAGLAAHVFVCGRTQSLLDQTVQSIRESGGSAESMVCDVTSLSSVEKAARAVALRGHCDILVNNAAVGGPKGPLHQLAPDEWDCIFNTDLRGVYYCIKAFVPGMIAAKTGHVINISSLAGKSPLPNGAAYSAAKWGLNGLSYSIAEELREHGIRVSVICPGSTNTEFTTHPGKDPQRMLQPDDVAHSVEMLVTQSRQSFCSEILLRPTLRP